MLEGKGKPNMVRTKALTEKHGNTTAILFMIVTGIIQILIQSSLN